MWRELPITQRNEYKRLILAFAGLTEMFAQKSDDDSTPAPVINSKFQETVFQRSFNATAEDIGNTSYDAALSVRHEGAEDKYLVGIKTFGINSGYQKVAQFKANLNEWSNLTALAERNAKNENGEYKEKSEIDRCNKDVYLKLALQIAQLRNSRIDSSVANIRGFRVDAGDDNVHSVYHVLMPSPKDEEPRIYVGETSYDKIDIANISIDGCTSKSHPANFVFKDGNHTYRYTSADSQLLMDFQNKDIVVEHWNVIYADDAYAIFSKIAEAVLGEEKQEEVAKEAPNAALLPQKQEITEEYFWQIVNEDGEVELFSGFNSFYGVGSKLGKDTRKQRIRKISEEYANSVPKQTLWSVVEGLKQFLLIPSSSMGEKLQKVELRKRILSLVNECDDAGFRAEVTKLLFRPLDEMYIPVPDAKNFHKQHPNFFSKGAGSLEPGTNSLKLPKEERRFNLVFEPSGDTLSAYITQDNGKAIESYEKQTYLGQWILRGIFQLDEYEPLTKKRLDEMGINALRLYRVKNSDDVHIEFVWKEPEEAISCRYPESIEGFWDMGMVAEEGLLDKYNK